MKPEKTQNFENEKSEEVKKDLLSEEDLEKVSGGYYIIHHDQPNDMVYGDTGNQVGKYEDFANFQTLSLEELKKLRDANR